ncbi:hypothetical protein DFJ63DRAFT_315310 [Scheffersomyces coipomensis]|uniref:uncharacterized protein n=1 Tax=Scheffersomyces coipomensis TaxID=1788519 RepID=UPI00315D416E
MKPKTTRSRTGCYTCRRRKKKCDELSFPTCHNCESKHLQCVWPKATQELYEKLRQVKYIDSNDNTSHVHHHSTNGIRQGPSTTTIISTSSKVLSNSKLEVNQDELSTVDGSPFDQYLQSPYSDYTDISETTKTINQSLPSNSNTLSSKKSSHILNMIAMQQDCVESDEDEMFSNPHPIPVPISAYPLSSGNSSTNFPSIITNSIPISTLNSTKSVKNKALHSAIALMESPRLETSDNPPPVFNIDFSRLSSPEV